MPMSLGIIVFSAISGWGVSLTSHYHPFIVAGAVLFTLETGLLLSLNISTFYGVEVVILIITGIGVGLLMQTLLVAAQSAVTSNDLASITTCCFFSDLLAISSVLPFVVQFSIIDLPKRCTKVFPTSLRKQYQTWNNRFIQFDSLILQCRTRWCKASYRHLNKFTSCVLPWLE